jgi:hypothetical protein
MMRHVILNSLVSFTITSEVGRTVCTFSESCHEQGQAFLQISTAGQYVNRTYSESIEDANLRQNELYAGLSGSDSKAGLLAIEPIDPKLKLVHIAKTGGTAVEHWGQKHGISWGFYWHELRAKKYGSPTQDAWHTPPRYFRENPYANYEPFAIVRNPYTRMISEFRCPWMGYFALAQKDTRTSKRGNATAADLNTWLQEKLQGGAARPPFKHGHMVPQYLYIFNAEGGRMIAADSTLRMERLGKDFADLTKRYNMSGEELDIVNDSDMKKFDVKDLSEVTRRLIEAEYSEDFRRFGYNMLPIA